jgi:hypothetical protein
MLVTAIWVIEFASIGRSSFASVSCQGIVVEIMIPTGERPSD